MKSGSLGQVPKRRTFFGKRSAVTFNGLSAEINKVVGDNKLKLEDKKKSIKNLIEDYVNVKVTENKNKFRKSYDCYMKLKNRSGVVREVVKELLKDQLISLHKKNQTILNAKQELFDNNLQKIELSNQLRTNLSKTQKLKSMGPPKDKNRKDALKKLIDKYESEKPTLDSAISQIKTKLEYLNTNVSNLENEFYQEYGIPPSLATEIVKENLDFIRN